MPDLLLELRSEEIPARMQRRAAADLKRLVTDALVEVGLTYEAARDYWTPRRLTLDVRGLAANSPGAREERKGPRTDAPEQAIAGFLRDVGNASIEVRSDPKKGDYLVAVIENKGRAAGEIIAEMLPPIIRDFPWPKSMRWGKASANAGSLRWIRPLQSIICTFGPETEDPDIIEFEVDGIRAGNVTCGHRFHASDTFDVRRFDDYVEKLEKARVVLDAERRKEIILADARNLAFANGLELIEDEGLLEEVAGLVEWPVVLLGEFEEEFLEIPHEVIRLTIKANQKCFVTRHQDGGMANRFVIVANLEASDGGEQIALGNARVVRARLADAVHFWKTDQADLPDLETLQDSADALGLDLTKPLDQRMARLDQLGVTFHAKLGTQGERVRRIAALAEHFSQSVKAAPDLARRAALLAKADLETEMVGEFPEMQGTIGRIYGDLQGEEPEVTGAIEDHYRPRGPDDSVPSEPESIAVALADKLDMLTGFWAVDEKPTSSKDPYGLRRAALGIIRIVLENGIRLKLHDSILSAVSPHLIPEEVRDVSFEDSPSIEIALGGSEYIHRKLEVTFAEVGDDRIRIVHSDAAPDPELLIHDLLAFFHDRLEVHLRDTGARYDLIDAVLASIPGRTKRGGDVDQSPVNDDLLTIVHRVEALESFLDTDEGANLLAGTKRAANIVSAEDKKGTGIAAAVDPDLFESEEERVLFDSLEDAEKFAARSIAVDDYSRAMGFMATLRQPIDSFFEAVLVNVEDEAVRANRLALLDRIRATTAQVADFSKIAG